MLPALFALCAFAAPEPTGDSTSTTALPTDPPTSEVEVDAPLLGRPYTPTAPGQITVDSPYWDLEVLYLQEKHLEGQKLAEERYAKTKDPHLTLHIARFLYQRLEGEEGMSKDERGEQYDYALAMLDEGIAADPSDKHLHFARGVVLARIGTTRGVLASLRLATEVEGAWLETVESDFVYHSIGTQEHLPCDAYLALGIFYRMVPDSWIVKALAGTKGDLERSLQMQEKGVACSGDRIRNLKELGVTQLCLGQKKKDPELIAAGKASINRYLGLTPTMEAEVVDIKHGVLLLKDPSLACEYSRDGQQDLDESRLER